uniref:NADH dehydrogenase subunit 6 n=1 Tax=Balamuthia mandrillaris TaxID=66527 RepID=A0A0K1DCE7_9EUKA|nr:NADH dehydrogenase subunit 6 [Balamuthia mandrillaris]AKT93860.1 NADH dehydrogenase subunit 6 [Balamuthia mandrillaris]AKT94945.1 NADH dehydrogenase subunit 6 [Balamuthia mandrillaris]AKT94994.1 NADH dehydrogenase subunit 6 [Balamuthia mandrillaris]AKT95033.1 NADH dehydrogenase subunit 6 [Balamuthia mandrillaris]
MMADSVIFYYSFCYSIRPIFDLSFPPVEYFTYLSYGLPDALEDYCDYTSHFLFTDMFFLYESGLLGWSYPVYFVDSLSSSLVPVSDIKLIALFLYNYLFVHLVILGFLFFLVIVGVISLLVNRNLYVKRQEIFEQQLNYLHHHVVQCI